MSTTEPCPTCEAWCCRDVSGMTVEHRAGRYARHVCPDCDAGLVWTTSAKSEPKPVWTAEQERAAVVTWLRNEWGQGVGMFAEAARRSIDCIERGEHRREEEP